MESAMSAISTLALLPLAPFILKLVLWSIGSAVSTLRVRSRRRILNRIPTGSDAETTSGDGDKSSQVSGWNGVIGFFHPFCAAGGGGERVLWAAIADTQTRYPSALCVIYTAEPDSIHDLASKARERFNIVIDVCKIHLVPVSFANLLTPAAWPVFTLIGQAVGSAIVAANGLAKFPPDIFVDTIGFSFAIAVCKLFFPYVRTGAYVHYPIVSSDMLDSLGRDSPSSEKNGDKTKKKGCSVRTRCKRIYWTAFSYLYGLVGATVDEVVANSSWTKDHLDHQWGPFRTPSPTTPLSTLLHRLFFFFPFSHHRRSRKALSPIEIVYPPVGVDELASSIDVSTGSERNRVPSVVYISQFRREKNHELVICAFAKLVKKHPRIDGADGDGVGAGAVTLALVGSTRNDGDAAFVDTLRTLADELEITSSIEFVVNEPWSTVRDRLATASIGVNGMWNEHFGIGVVEYQAAGLVAVVNNSGGPARDIVVDYHVGGDGGDVEGQMKSKGEAPSTSGRTGYKAKTVDEYAAAMAEVLLMDPVDRAEIRKRARANAFRFSTGRFNDGWGLMLDRLVKG